jgi:hypothetical protein
MKDLFSRKEAQPIGQKLNRLVERVERLKTAILELEETIQEHEPVQEDLQDPVQDLIINEKDNSYIFLESPKQKQKSNTDVLEQEAIATVTKNKKQIIKQKIIGVAAKNKVTAQQLKEIVVDKNKYCSKATFYRYMAELRAENRLEAIQINNKEYIYGIQKEYRI